MLVRGDRLSPQLQAQVLDRYVHRMTHEARRRWPAHAQRMLASGYRMPAQSDAEWLRAYYFEVTKSGRLSHRRRSAVPASLVRSNPRVQCSYRRNPRFSWHKIKCMTCGRVERYRGLAHIGAPGHRCMSCRGATKVTEMHWGPEKYAASRGKTGLVEKLTPQQFYAPFPPGTRY